MASSVFYIPTKNIISLCDWFNFIKIISNFFLDKQQSMEQWRDLLEEKSVERFSQGYQIW